MTNPASLLLAQLENWRVPAGHNFRGVRLDAEGGRDDQVTAATSLAIQHLADIEEILSGMEAEGRRVEPYRRVLPRWRRWVLAYPSSWTHAVSNDEYNNQSDLDLLAALADVIDQFLPVYSEEQRSSVRDSLEGIRIGLVEDMSLPQALRRHINGLLLHAFQCLDEYERFGDFELKKAVDRLIVSVNVAASVSEDKTRWQNLRDNLVYPVLAGWSISAPTAVAAILPNLPLP